MVNKSSTALTFGVLVGLLFFSKMSRAATGARAGETWLFTVTTSRPLTADEWNDLQSSFIIRMNDVAGVKSQAMSGNTLSLSITFKKDVPLDVGSVFPMVSAELPIPSMEDVVTTLANAKKVS